MRRAIIHRHTIIDANFVTGFDAEADRARYQVTPGGVVVVPKGRADYFARNSRGRGAGYDE
jgi:glucose-1-phosphate adenylyltransferase